MDNLELVAKLMVSWSILESEGRDLSVNSEEVLNDSFIAKVLIKRMEVFKIDIHIPDHLIAIIELCVGGNPGMAQMVLSKIMKNIPNLKPGYTITANDFIRVYTMRFPIVSMYKDIETELNEMWDDQKYSNGNFSCNKCDTPEYWLSFFK